MELSSLKICTAIPTSRISTVFCFCFSPPPKALPEVVRRMPRKRISGLEALLQQRSRFFISQYGEGWHDHQLPIK
ncbi:PREDICTED: uncharacterized protein encoded by LINC01551-like isoform X2 [Rhinopithecus bieti]|uniref:uncharacterized protein encoded by LINC01551-like isoform X2 n=1 Tax=Rhinopithecus bieti TaxID=61621 RepID=UPI00083C55BF|nr:PREDICTED: uncharacterized protein encoded by LINC01551-like isoform X2 [Rhinopithecus bieti]